LGSASTAPERSLAGAFGAPLVLREKKGTAV